MIILLQIEFIDDNRGSYWVTISWINQLLLP